jgi:hypothetical protein
MPASPRDWADPFLEQAHEDLSAAWVVYSQQQGPSTLCMLLQMVFEKMGKAAIARSGVVVPRKHQVATRFFDILKRDGRGARFIRNHEGVQQFVAELELAHPAVASGHWPQLEYPWVDPGTGAVFYPAKNLPLARRAKDPKDLITYRCLKFASALEKLITTIVP